MRHSGFQGCKGFCFPNLSVKMVALLSKKIKCFFANFAEMIIFIRDEKNAVAFFHQSFILKPYSLH